MNNNNRKINQINSIGSVPSLNDMEFNWIEDY